MVRLCHQGLPAGQLLGQVFACVRAAVGFDASFWAITDPAALLPTGGLVHNLPADICEPYYAHELLVPDVNKFVELVGATRTVGVLSQATSGDLRQSARYRVIGEPLGIEDELRVVFVANGLCWGFAALLRRHGAYSGREASFVAGVSAHIGHGLRTALLATAAQGHVGAPGTVVVDANGRIEAVTPEAEQWMAELIALTERTGYPQQPVVPPTVYIVAARARAALAGRDDGVPSARVRTRTGQWLIVHGSALRGANGPDGRVAVVIEPARPAEIAPVIVAAWQLTEREQDVLRLVCRGLSTEQIAHELVLSPHTVRGYLKGLFAKVGVSSRSELVAALFADHYHDRLFATASVVGDTVQ
ncbi:response regulator transcription factor [Dactylosporangium sp. CA-139066]|uniref:response regulator transcription factor n=1 Tax=Dactylosporangium sp. CA-139066 TaxID=3239930 RepID=UPI003D8AFBC4